MIIIDIVSLASENNKHNKNNNILRTCWQHRPSIGSLIIVVDCEHDLKLQAVIELD